MYGPVFLTICGLLNKISCLSVILFLYEFKILNFITYLATVFLVYKLTKNKKLTIVYCFNPLILLEVLVNVHNDIFVLFFALLGTLLLKESEKIKENYLKSEIVFILGLIFFAISALIKYVMILVLPFLILYRLRNEKIIKKLIKAFLYFVVFLGIFVSLYLPYFNNIFEIFEGVISQSGKLKDSIYMIIAMITNQNSNIVSTFYSIGFFVLLYIFIIKVLMQLLRKNDFNSMMKNSYIVLFALIFLGLTNLTSWYLIWLFLPVFWTTGKDVKNLIWLSFLYELTYTIFYFVHSDNTYYQVWILPFIAIVMIFREIIVRLKENNRKLEEND